MNLAVSAAQQLNLAVRTIGAHATGRTLTLDLAGWMDDAGNPDPTLGEADVNAPHPSVSQRVTRRSG